MKAKVVYSSSNRAGSLSLLKDLANSFIQPKQWQQKTGRHTGFHRKTKPSSFMTSSKSGQFSKFFNRHTLQCDVAWKHSWLQSIRSNDRTPLDLCYFIQPWTWAVHNQHNSKVKSAFYFPCDSIIGSLLISTQALISPVRFSIFCSEFRLQSSSLCADVVPRKTAEEQASL